MAKRFLESADLEQTRTHSAADGDSLRLAHPGNGAAREPPPYGALKSGGPIGRVASHELLTPWPLAPSAWASGRRPRRLVRFPSLDPSAPARRPGACVASRGRRLPGFLRASVPGTLHRKLRRGVGGIDRRRRRASSAPLRLGDALPCPPEDGRDDQRSFHTDGCAVGRCAR